MSAEMKVIDSDGEWFVNTAQFRFANGERDGVIFEPGLLTRVRSDKWIENQPLIKKVNDPFKDPMPAMVVSETVLQAAPDAPVVNVAPPKKR